MVQSAANTILIVRRLTVPSMRISMRKQYCHYNFACNMAVAVLCSLIGLRAVNATARVTSLTDQNNPTAFTLK